MRIMTYDEVCLQYKHAVLHTGIAFVLVDTSQGEVFVPQDWIAPDNTITLDISPDTVKDLHISEHTIVFRADVDGKDMVMRFPISNVIDLITGDGKS